MEPAIECANVEVWSIFSPLCYCCTKAQVKVLFKTLLKVKRKENWTNFIVTLFLYGRFFYIFICSSLLMSQSGGL